MSDFARQQIDEHWQREPWTEIADPGNARRIADIADLCPSGLDRALEVGCGNADVLRALRGKAAARWGCDPSAAGLRVARLADAHGGGGTRPLTLVQASGDHLPFADRSFTLVACCAVLEHLPAEVAARTLQEIARVAARWVLIHLPLCEDLGWSQLRCTSCGCSYHRDHHLRSYTEAEILSLLPPADFAVAARRTTGWRVRRPVKLPPTMGARLMLGHDPTIRCPACGAPPAPLGYGRRLLRDSFVFVHNALTRPFVRALTRDTDLVVLFSRRQPVAR